MEAWEGWIGRLLGSARAKPALALVELWCRVREHGLLERVDRSRCERDAERLLAALDRAGPLPLVHPAAAIRALDRYLSEGDDASEPHWRRIEMPRDPGGGTYWLVPRRSGWSSRLSARQARHVEYWMRHYQVVPAAHRSLEISIRRAPAPLWKALAAPATPFAAGGFLDGVHPDWTCTSPYRCRALADPGLRWESVKAALEEAAGRGARIVVLPELTVDPPVRLQVRAWLRSRRDHPFALVVAGSFHEPLPGGGAGEGRSVAYAFDAWGDVVTTHVKLRPMATMEGKDPLDEDLVPGKKVELVRAPFGLLALAICLDFCEIAGAAVADVWTLIGPALVLVPSMGGASTNHAHGDRARPLVLQHATITIVASQHPKEAEALGLCFQPGSEPAVERPMLHGVILWTQA